MLQRPIVQRQRIGPAIRKLRHQQALTLDDLAAQAGISASHLSRLERGQTLPSFTVLAGIAHVLGVSIDEFAQLEQDVTVLDQELGEMLGSLGIDEPATSELLSLSIESRRTLVDVLTHLAAMPISPQDVQDQIVRAVAENGLVDSSQTLIKLISASGLSPVAFTRALIWLNTSPGRKRMLMAKQGLIGAPAEDFPGLYRALTGSEPISPEISAWHQHTAHTMDVRTIVSRSILLAFFQNGTWVKGGPVVAQEERARIAQRIANSIDAGNLELGITDIPLGDVNVRVSEDDVLLESTRLRGSVEHLGIVLRGHKAAGVFIESFDSCWDSLPAEDKDPATVRTWLRNQAQTESLV